MDPAMQGVIVGGSIAIVSSVVGAYVNHRLELRRMKAKEEQEEVKRLRAQLLDTEKLMTLLDTDRLLTVRRRMELEAKLLKAVTDTVPVNADADAERLSDGCCRRCGMLKTLGSKYCKNCGERYDEATTGTES